MTDLSSDCSPQHPSASPSVLARLNLSCGLLVIPEEHRSSARVGAMSTTSATWMNPKKEVTISTDGFRHGPSAFESAEAPRHPKLSASLSGFEMEGLSRSRQAAGRVSKDPSCKAYRRPTPSHLTMCRTYRSPPKTSPTVPRPTPRRTANDHG